MSPGHHLARREQVLDLASDRLGLGALAATAPEANRAASSALLGVGGSASLRALRAAPDRAVAASAAAALPSVRRSGARRARLARRRGRRTRTRRSAPVAEPRKRRTHWSASKVATTFAPIARAQSLEQARDGRARRPRARRPSGARSARRSPRRHRRARASRRASSVTRSPPSRAARLAQDPVVAGVELGELELAPRPARDRPIRRPPCRARRPSRAGARARRLGLEHVDPPQQPRQQPCRVAADLVPAQRQLVDAVEHDRRAGRPA